VVFYIRHLCTTLSKFTVMRVFLSLVALVAGAQALSSSLYQKRGGVDTCANVDCSVDFSNPVGGKTLNFGNIKSCLCLSGIPSFVKSDSALSKASIFVGSSKVSDFITSQVKQGKNCNYPDHGVPAPCSKSDPCDFDCSDGYTPSQGKCVCKSPYKECNGKCGSFSNCPSKTPHKRDADEWKRNVRCDKGYTACGVLGYSRFAEAYECVNARDDLESCGGCSIPLHRGSPLGVDCTSLPGVADVSCMSGSCYIHKCMPGYQLSVDNSECMDDDTVEKFLTVAEFGWERFVPIGLN